jgi:ABC-2 type transport system ATP-binding protein
LERLSLTAAADRMVLTYSGGMRRRVDLGASLVGRPLVLIMDEPTTGLDPSTRSELWKLIDDLVRQGTTVLLTTQYLEEADRLADHIVVIDDGRIIAQGSAAELKSRLGTTVVEARLGSPQLAARAKQRLSPLGTTETIDDGRTISVNVADSGPALIEVVRLLESGGLTPESLAVREPTLDDVFLQLTGHMAEVAVAPSPVASKRGAA